MTSRQIVAEISQLPLSEKISIVEIILKEIQEETQNGNSLANGAKILAADYENDNNLTVFTSIDTDDFYETK